MSKITEPQWQEFLCKCGKGPDYDHEISCPAYPDVVSASLNLADLLDRVNALVAERETALRASIAAAIEYQQGVLGLDRIRVREAAEIVRGEK